MHDLDSYISDIDAESTRAATSFVFRIPTSFRDDLNAADTLDARRELRRRTRLPIQFLYYHSPQHHLLELLPDATVAAAETGALAAIRQADLLRVVRACEDVCYYQGNTKHHFVAPSLKHCSAFFRLGDAIRSRVALDSIAFWLQEHIDSCDGILIDTWSIASVVLRAQQMCGKSQPMDCLANHPQRARDEAVDTIRQLRDRMTESPRLACIVSVISSGRYADIVTEICRDNNIQDVQIVGVYKLSNVTGTSQALCALDLEPENYPADNCSLCDSGSEPIFLHPGLYYLKDLPERATILKAGYFEERQEGAPPPPNAVPAKSIAPKPSLWRQLCVRLKPRHTSLPASLPTGQRTSRPASATSRFIREYAAIPKLFAVHRTNRHGRHHAFHVSVSALLMSVGYLQKYKDLLARHETPDLVLCPQDPVAIALADIAADHFGCPRIAADSLRELDRLPDADATAIRAAQNYLIVDDVFVTGSRLTAYNVALRNLKEPSSIRFIVGLARPQSYREWKGHEIQLTKRVAWRASLTAVEELWLPDWENRHCPWCRELELLREAATRLPEAPEWLRARIEVLDRDGGVEHDALWFLAGIDHPVLGNGSLLGPQGLTPLSTLFSLVIALQRLRSDPQEPLNPHFPDFRVLDPRNLRNFSEGLIQAAVLRAVLPKEWGLTSQSKNLSETIIWGLSQTGGKVLLAEVLLAIARGALDPSLLARLAPYYTDNFAETYKVLATAISR